ncbi:MAG: hypothetical protein V9E81_15540 [Marmoricola sp.]
MTRLSPLITCDSDGNKQLLSKAVIEGNQLKTASFGTPSNGIAWAVNLTFKSDATDTFGKVTTKLAGTGKLFAIVLDGSVLSSPRVIQPILDGRPQITGNFTQQKRIVTGHLVEVRRPALAVQRQRRERRPPTGFGHQLAAHLGRPWACCW